MRSDARKRLEGQHQEHPDPAVRELLNKARAEAWDEGYGAGQRTDVGAWTQAPNPYRGA